jgi:ribonuclease HI
MTKVTIYTDGSCSGNPGPGGWGAILIYNDIKKEISGGENPTTNNKMELTAALNALLMLKHPCEVDLYSDSAYLINCFKNDWLKAWKKNNWVNSKKEPVKNVDLWMKLDELTLVHKINWIKVKGHADNKYNNRCDELARIETAKFF